MAESRYAKYVVPAPILPSGQSDRKQIEYPMLLVSGKKHLSGMPFSMGWLIVTEPQTFVEQPHSHPDHQIFCFMGGNAKDISDFDAEIWMYLGEEQEKFVITSPSMVWVPGWMKHCPIIFHRVTKPFMYMDIALIAEHGNPPIPKESQRAKMKNISYR
jgi:hypothetical protein